MCARDPWPSAGVWCKKVPCDVFQRKYAERPEHVVIRPPFLPPRVEHSVGRTRYNAPCTDFQIPISLCTYNHRAPARYYCKRTVSETFQYYEIVPASITLAGTDPLPPWCNRALKFGPVGSVWYLSLRSTVKTPRAGVSESAGPFGVCKRISRDHTGGRAKAFRFGS